MTRAFVRPALIVLGVALLARCVLVQVFAIPSGSMKPTLEPGDQILVTSYQLPWESHEPQRGDVVVFRRLDGIPGFFVKRVIAVPGDHLEIRGGAVLIDGHALPESYVLSKGKLQEMSPEIVPAESYFVMGDHREDSIDSRVWGFVPRSNLVGKARMVFWSAGGESAHQSAVASAAIAGRQPISERIRWRRVFLPIH